MDFNGNINAMRPRFPGAVSVSGAPAKGDTVRAHIARDLGGGRYAAVFRGTTVTVASREPLPVGASVVLTVDDATDRIFARLLGTAAGTGNKGSLTAVLKGMGLPPGGNAQAAAARLLTLDIPFNAALMNRITDALALPLTGTAAQQLDTVLLAVLKGLPLKPAILAALQQALFGGTATGDAVKETLQFIRKHSQGGGKGSADDETVALLERLLPDFNRMTVGDALTGNGRGAGDGQNEGSDAHRAVMLKLLRKLSKLRQNGAGTDELTGHIRTILLHHHGQELIDAVTGPGEMFMSVPLERNGRSQACRVHMKRTGKADTAVNTLHFSITTENLDTVKAEVTLGVHMVDCSLQGATGTVTELFDTHREELAGVLRTITGGLAAVSCRTVKEPGDAVVARLLAPGSDRGLDTVA